MSKRGDIDGSSILRVNFMKGEYKGEVVHCCHTSTVEVLRDKKTIETVSELGGSGVTTRYCRA